MSWFKPMYLLFLIPVVVFIVALTLGIKHKKHRGEISQKKAKRFEAFYAALKANGYEFDSNVILGDDTEIHYGFSRLSIALNGVHDQYYYEKRVGSGYIQVYIFAPYSEHNKNEVEKVIRILKSVY